MATIASRGRRRARARLGPRSRLTQVVAGLFAAALGLELYRFSQLPVGVWLGAGPVLVLFGFLVMQEPRWCLAALLASTVFGLSHSGVLVGPFDLRVIDVFYVALVFWMVQVRAKDGPLLGRQIGQRQLGLWLAALGISLFPLLVHAPGALTGPLVGWLRIVQTLSLVWLVPYALRKVDDLEFILGFVGVILTAEIGRDVVHAVLAGHPATRLGGANGPDTTGLLSALVILLAVHSPVPRRRALRGAMLALGSAGLLMSHSLGAIAAVTASLAIFGFHSARAGPFARKETLLIPARVLLLVVAGLAVAATIKPGGLPGSKGFASSSTVHRSIVAAAGLELFTDHPVTGTGWGAAPTAAESRRINARLKRLFAKDVSPAFFPEATTGQIYVHNAYVQILAEAGLVGFGFFVAAAFVLTRGVGSVLRMARGQPRVYASARCALVLLITILVWWNDNTLFGAQPESVLAATFLGLLAAVPLLAPAPPASIQATV